MIFPQMFYAAIFFPKRLADDFYCQKQQLRPFQKPQRLWFPHCQSFRPCFSYENL